MGLYYQKTPSKQPGEHNPLLWYYSSVKSQKLKILHVITKGNWGGAQRYVFDIATRLPHDHYESVVVYGEGTILGEKLNGANIRTIRISSLGRDIDIVNDIKSAQVLFNIIRTEAPDIVHLNSSKIGAIGAVVARIAKVPNIIFTGHGWAWNEDRTLLSKALITCIHWLTIQLCHTTIAVCEDVKRQILRLPFVSAEKIRVIPNGIGEIVFEEKHAARSKIGGGSEKIWIGAIGELHRNKGFDILIDAFSRIDHETLNVGLYIIGEGEERKNLEQKIAEKHLEDSVYLLGFIPNASTLLKAFDIFVMSSRTEAFPYVLLEAGLAQLPVIAPRVGGVPELVHHMETGLLFDRGDVADLSRHLQLLIRDSALVAEISQAIRKQVENIFTIERMVDQTIDVYNK